MILGIVGSTSVIILGITIACSMSKPIKELTNATEILASGNLNHRVQISRNDEIGILAKGFNTMAESLDKEITERKRILEELRTLNESLEQRVAERTAAVEKMNEELRMEVSEHKKLKENLVYLADYDPLTNLFNRRRFQKEIDGLLAYSRRYGVEGTLLFLDLDNFKYLNDVHGHQVGDEFLVELAGLLKGRLRQTDIVARLGGDEFAIYLPQVDTNQAMVVAEGIAKLIEQHAMVIKGQQQPAGVTASIGVVLFPLHGTMPEELLTCADIAMYQAKKEGGNSVCVYNVDQKMEIESLLNWKNRIQVALTEDRFVLHFQPIKDFNQFNIIGYEALLRMVDENGKLIPPSSFISVAEHFGLMREIRFGSAQGNQIPGRNAEDQ